MPKSPCCRQTHPKNCSCGMLSLYRFVEPLVLYLLKKNKQAYGYDLLPQIQKHTLTEAPIDGPCLYRTLRLLEKNGHVTSIWDTTHLGPARHQYSLTPSGEQHLQEWREVLSRLQGSIVRFVGEIDEQKKSRKRKKSLYENGISL